MDAISELSRADRSTVWRLTHGRSASFDSITGLVGNIKDQFYKEHPEVKDLNWNYGTTTINGSTLPGTTLPLQDVVETVDKIVGNQHLTVSFGTRMAGTRVGIHVHESGGTTFVLDGTGGKGGIAATGRITDFVQGAANNVCPVGTYYYMPSNIPMVAANLSDSDVRLMDIFLSPVGQPSTTIIEPGYPGYNPPA